MLGGRKSNCMTNQTSMLSASVALLSVAPSLPLRSFTVLLVLLVLPCNWIRPSTPAHYYRTMGLSGPLGAWYHSAHRLRLLALAPLSSSTKGRVGAMHGPSRSLVP